MVGILRKKVGIILRISLKGQKIKKIFHEWTNNQLLKKLKNTMNNNLNPIKN